MAHMIPSEPKEFDVNSHEGDVFHALEKLSDEYYVFHSVETMAKMDNSVSSKEIDFLVVHRNKGILSIEVKAGSGISHQDGNWYYTNGLLMPHGGPYRQARIASSTLRNRVKNHENPAVQKMANNCKFVSAVWFPDMTVGGLNRLRFPTDGLREITLCFEDLADPTLSIEQILDLDIYIGNTPIQNRMSETDLNLLVNEVISPTFHLLRMPSVERETQKLRFHMLLKEQVSILDFLEEQPSAVINGAAGTGKTMIAVEKARRHSVQGDKVLFLCFNRMLRDHLKQVYQTNISNDYANVDFMTISALARRKTGQMDDYNGLEEWLYRCCDHPEEFEYQHIIVDEGQDFSVLGATQTGDPDGNVGCEIIDLLELVAFNKGGTFYLFCDKKQIVQGMRIRNGSKIKVPNCIDDADCKLTLHRNCRNTKEIASTSQKPLPQDKYSYGLLQIPGSGKKPHMYAVENAAKQQTYVNRAIDCLRADGYDDIVILTMNTLTNSILSDFAQALGNGDYNRMYSYAGKQYLFSNCSKFKGLEADAIILIDIDVAAFNEKAMYFYVGTSRARTRLELIANLSLEDCGKVAKVLDETAPSRKNMVPILKNILGCDIDIV